MKKYFFKHKLLSIVVVSLSFVSAVGAVGIAYILQQIIDTATNKDLEQFKFMVLIAVMYFIVFGVLNYLYKNSIGLLSSKVNFDIRMNIFNGMIFADYEKISHENMGKFISLMGNDVKILEESYIKPIFSIVENGIMFILTLISFLLISPKVTICLIIGVAILGVVPNLIGKVLERRQEVLSNSYSEFTQGIKGILDGLEVLKIFGKETYFSKIFTEFNAKLKENKYKADKVEALGDSLSFVFGFLLMVLVIIASAYQVLLGVITLGTLVALIQLSNTLVNPIINIMGCVAKVQSSGKIFDKVEQINLMSRESTKYEHTFQKDIFLEQVSCRFGERVILKDVSLRVQKGKKYLITGKSGAGKSTLLKLLGGIIREYDGKMFIDECDVSERKFQGFNKEIAIVNQNTFLFDMTIEENIILGSKIDNEKLRYVIDISRLSELLIRGDKKVGEGGKLLSGGERQRVAIARALYHNKPVLFLDESTSALDKQVSGEIENSLLSIDDMTIVSVNHNIGLDMLKKYDEIILVKDKKAVTFTNVEEFIKLDS